ncbi:transposase [Streptomyces sp. V3I8]|uniref:helix-turn-helix domain-containing protein n=1 Tax=Streptomyces sp. V3I8 TaxID=3042279 RepID=UPI00278B24C4|nr:helix-turn-helix domain-containing protein [Streptomyces sp. V3I8]MDQ1036752.1 transposase [Streptomyces sp. V3I8]
MEHAPGKYADFEGLRERAMALRREGLSRRQIRDRLQVHNNDILNRLLEGEPPPEWTKRPRAKDDLRARVRELRLQGWTYDRIQAELGCSKSSISLWVRDLPKPERPRRTREEASAIAKRGWEATMRLREEERQRAKAAAADDIGTMSDRELFLVGVGLYWAEGTKDKPHARREFVTFVNSDPGMIDFFLRWLDLLGVGRDRVRYCVMIHETADVAGAERYWADLVGADSSAFNKTTIKKHNPKTVRKNIDATYRGCLVIKVHQSADLYRRIEGAWYGIVLSARKADQNNRT